MMNPQLSIVKEMPLPIVGANTFGRYEKISTEQTWNMMISDDCLVPWAGYQLAVILQPGASGREIFWSPKFQHFIVVMDANVYSVDANLGYSKIGTLLTIQGNVFIAENDAKQIALVDGLNVYIYDWGAGTFSVVLQATLGFNPVYITYQDTYFISVDGLSNQWRLSASNNGLSWPNDAQHIGALENNKADICIAAVVLDRQLFVFGKSMGVMYYDVGYTLFPYQRNNYYSIDYGCLSAETIATGFGLLVWLAYNEKSGAAIMVSRGGNPEQISTDGINYIIENLTNPADSYGYLYKEAGHIFYVIIFKTDNISYIYDFNTNKFFTITDNNLNYFNSKRIGINGNKSYFISFTDGNMYQIGTSIYTYNGAEIPRIRLLPTFKLPNDPWFIAQYASLTLEQGNSLREQIVQLSLSKDGGATYGSSARKILNIIGKRKNRLRFWNLGAANDLRMQFRFYGFDKFVITGGNFGYYQ